MPSAKKEKSLTYLDSLENSEMAVLLIKLLPFMKQSAQEFSLNNICRLCTLNIKNQIKSCKNAMLLNLIRLLHNHKKFDYGLIGNNGFSNLFLMMVSVKFFLNEYKRDHV